MHGPKTGKLLFTTNHFSHEVDGRSWLKGRTKVPRQALFALAHCIFTTAVLIREYNARVKLYSECLCSWLLLYFNITSMIYVDIKVLHNSYIMKKGNYLKRKTLCCFINYWLEVIQVIRVWHFSNFGYTWNYRLCMLTCHLYQLTWIFYFMHCLKCSSSSELNWSATNS